MSPAMNMYALHEGVETSHDEETSDNESRRVTEDNIASPDDFDPNVDDEGVESEELTRYGTFQTWGKIRINSIDRGDFLNFIL